MHACGSFGSDPAEPSDAGVEAIDVSDAHAPDDVADADAQDANEAEAEAPLIDAGPPYPCNGDAGCGRLVFVTSAVWQGNLGGVSGADAKCNEVAQASPLPMLRARKWVAW